MSAIKNEFSGPIIFCPSYYSDDKILDRVFGERPTGYLEKLAQDLEPSISVIWTGPEVISKEISLDHLKRVESILKRKPFLWENLFANDGPRNCKFLKIKAYHGRERGLLNSVSGIGLNLMNQPYLSQISYMATSYTLKGERPEMALHKALEYFCAGELQIFLKSHIEQFSSQGLDQMSSEEKGMYIQKLSEITSPFSTDLIDWLEGKYLVGSECLTD
jgi:hypothetical protein